MSAYGFTVVIDATAIHAKSGGAGTYLRNLVRELPSVGIKPVILARRNDTFEWPGAQEVHRLAPTNRLQRLVWEQTVLGRRVSELVPQGTVILHSPHYTTPRQLDARIRRVVTIHDLTFFSRPEDHSRSKRVLFRKSILQSARLADVIVAVSHTTADAYSRVTKRHNGIVVAQHGVDHDRFTSNAQLTELQRESDNELLGAASVHRPYVLFLGTIEPRKQVSALIEAFKALSQSNHEIGLVLAGQLWPGMQANLPSIGERETRLGFVTDAVAVALLRNASVVAYPSAEEGFGLPMLEAMACGAPVVAAASEISREVCGDAATLISHQPSGDFAKRLCAALEAAMAGSAPSTAVAEERSRKFTWQRSAENHLGAYQIAYQNAEEIADGTAPLH